MLPKTTTISALSLPTTNLVNNDKQLKRSFILPTSQTTNYLNAAYSVNNLNTNTLRSKFQLQPYHRNNLVADYFIN